MEPGESAPTAPTALPVWRCGAAANDSRRRVGGRPGGARAGGGEEGAPRASLPRRPGRGRAQSAPGASAAIALAHNLDQRVIAEGVETEGQLGRLRLLGCDVGQGNLFAEPLPSEAALALFEETLQGKPRWAVRQHGPG